MSFNVTFDILLEIRLSGVAEPFDKLRTCKDIQCIWEIPDNLTYLSRRRIKLI